MEDIQPSLLDTVSSTHCYCKSHGCICKPIELPELPPKSPRRRQLSKSRTERVLSKASSMLSTNLKRFSMSAKQKCEVDNHSVEIHSDNDSSDSEATINDRYEASAAAAIEGTWALTTPSADVDIDPKGTLISGIDPVKTTTFAIQAHTYRSSKDTYESTFQINAPWRQKSTSSCEDLVKHTTQSSELTTQVSWALDASELPLASVEMGKVRLFAKSKTELSPAVSDAYLFDRYLVTLQPSDDGFETVDAIFDLEDDLTIIDVEGERSVIEYDNLPYILQMRTVAESFMWLCAIFNKSMIFPSLSKFETYPAVEGRIEVVICVPFYLLSIILPDLLSRLRPQDRLGVVVSSDNGCLAYLGLHKPSWTRWKFVIRLEMSSLDLFTTTSSDPLDTAVQLLHETKMPQTGLTSQSIIFVSSCETNPVTTLSTTLPVHVIGFGNYDVNLISRISDRHPCASFQHAETRAEVVSCIVGLVAAEQSTLYNDVSLAFTIPQNSCLLANLGESSPAASFRTLKMGSAGNTSVTVRSGNSLAGQTRSVVMRIKTSMSEGSNICDNLHLVCTNTFTGFEEQPKISSQLDDVNSIPSPLIFSNTVCILAEFLEESFELAQESDLPALFQSIDRAVNSAMERKDMTKSCFAVDSVSNSFQSYISFLAQGLVEFRSRVYKLSKSSNTYPLSGALREVQQTLGIQRSVTSRSMSDRLFFEKLECNSF